MSTPELISSILNSGIMIVILGLLLKGEIIPKTVVDRILTEAENRSTAMTQAIFKELQAHVQEAVKDGIIEGHKETGVFAMGRQASQE